MIHYSATAQYNGIKIVSRNKRIQMKCDVIGKASCQDIF